MEQKRKATIVDVAKLAGVSVATVSRVVNANYPVKEETRTRVQAAIKELDYVPNVQARELNTRRSSTTRTMSASCASQTTRNSNARLGDPFRVTGGNATFSCGWGFFLSRPPMPATVRR